MSAPEHLCLPQAALDRLMPMHAVVGPTGHILAAGPTLEKLFETGLIGERFLEAFELKRPRNVSQIADLRSEAGQALSLRLRSAPQTPLKGLALTVPGQDVILVNLSFGIAAVDAVGVFDLTAGDFPPTDLTVEMLYLVEAKEAVMEESRNLNLRLQGAKIAAEEQAFTDTLTGLKNRRAMDMILARYTAAREKFGLMHLDLDFFKEVNDTLGHAAGDFVLQEAARILVEETRSEDTIVRAGGDEFVLIFHRLTRADRLSKVANRILARLEEPMLFGETPCRVSGSIGIAVSSDYPEPDTDQMLADADAALYASKNAGRARHTFARDVSVPASIVSADERTNAA